MIASWRKSPYKDFSANDASTFGCRVTPRKSQRCAQSASRRTGTNHGSTSRPRVNEAHLTRFSGRVSRQASAKDVSQLAACTARECFSYTSPFYLAALADAAKSHDADGGGHTKDGPSSAFKSLIVSSALVVPEANAGNGRSSSVRTNYATAA